MSIMGSSREKNTSCLSRLVKEDELVQFQLCLILNGVDSYVQTIWRFSKQLYGRKTNKQTNPGTIFAMFHETDL